MRDLQRLTLEEKVGQLFFLGFQGFTPDAETQARIARIRPGGFIFSQRNIESFDQIYALTSSLRESGGVPAFLAIDHEGGRVDRLKQVFAQAPSVTESAAHGVSHMRACAKIIAAEIEAAGFNMNFAPVADIGIPGRVMAERSLSSRPSDITRFAGIFIEELSKKDIFACVKHFPGMGAATLDPHFVLPRIDRTKRQLMQEDVLPFLGLIDAADMIMVSHAHYPGLGDERPTPASLSPRIIEGLLRKKLGFQNLIITSDLTMGAITGLGLTPELFLRAFEAGNDMLLFSQTTPLIEIAFRQLVKVIRSSAALSQRLDESVNRIFTLKNRIQFMPLRFRAHLQSRIVRQIEKLRASAETPVQG